MLSCRHLWVALYLINIKEKLLINTLKIIADICNIRPEFISCRITEKQYFWYKAAANRMDAIYYHYKCDQEDHQYCGLLSTIG